ncbi:hypothetical protein ACMDCT_10345 [Halomonadaceae bacterium KBTZ08]
MTTAVMASGAEHRIEVRGLSCPFCTDGIEKQRTKVEGVEALATNIKAGTITM